MIPSLIRRDTALRNLLPWLWVSVLQGAIFVGQTGLEKINDGAFTPDSYFWIPALSWTLLALFLVFARVTDRCGEFQMVLPLPTRVILLSHVSALMLSCVILLAGAIVIFTLGNVLGGRGAWGGSDALWLAVRLLAGAALAVAILQGVSGSGAWLASRPWTVLGLVVLWGAILAPVILLRVFPAYAVAVPFGAAILITWRTSRKLPVAFLMPVEESGVARGDWRLDQGASKASGSRRVLVPSAVLRSLYGHKLNCVLLGLIGLLGFFAFRRPYPNTLAAYWLLVWIPVLLSGLFRTALAGFQFVEAWPLSRRWVFASLVLPGLIAAWAGYGIPAASFWSAPPKSLVEQGANDLDSCSGARIPYELWEIGWTNAPLSPPNNSGPGCSNTRFSVFEGLPLELRPPFQRSVETPPGSPWARLIKTVPVLFLLIGLPWLLYLGVMIRFYSSGSWAAHLVLTAVAALALVATIWGSNVGQTAEWKLNALAGALIGWISSFLPDNTLGQWGPVTVLLAGVYLFAEVRFRRYESPARTFESLHHPAR